MYLRSKSWGIFSTPARLVSLMSTGSESTLTEEIQIIHLEREK